MTHLVSGCGPGPTYPDDTPTQGARSVDKRTVVSEAVTLHVGVESAAVALRTARVLTAEQYRELSRTLQKAADRAAWLGKRA